MNLLLFSVFGRRQDAGDKRLSHQVKMWAVNLSANHKYVHIRTCQSVISRLRCMFISVSYSWRGWRTCVYILSDHRRTKTDPNEM